MRIVLSSKRLRYGLMGIACFWLYFVFLSNRQGSRSKYLSQNVEQKLSGYNPPDIKAKIQGQVQELESTSDCSVFHDLSAPFVVRQAVSDWPAIQKWTFDWIYALNITVDVLIAPSLVFTTYNKFLKTPDTALEHPPGVIPSTFRTMSSEEALQRMSVDGHYMHKKLYYNKESSRKERYYMRFDIEDDLYDDIDLDVGLLRCLDLRGSPRLWVSVKGSSSPMHWDADDSCLVQIRGSKRMLFYKPDDIDNFGSYSKQHALYRRAKFDPVNPDYRSYPKAKKSEGVLAVLHAGKILKAFLQLMLVDRRHDLFSIKMAASYRQSDTLYFPESET